MCAPEMKGLSFLKFTPLFQNLRKKIKNNKSNIFNFKTLNQSLMSTWNA